MSSITQKPKKEDLSFGQRLVQIRKAKGLTQGELGKRIGVSQRIIHHYENKAEYPPAKKIMELVGALGMSVDELLGVNDNANNSAYQHIKPKLAKRLRLCSNLPSHDLKALTTLSMPYSLNKR